MSDDLSTIEQKKPVTVEEMLRGIIYTEKDKRSVRVGFVGEREAQLFKSWLIVQASDAGRA